LIVAILHNLSGSLALEESHRILLRRGFGGRATAGTPSIFPKPLCTNNLRNLIHSKRRFVVETGGIMAREGGADNDNGSGFFRALRIAGRFATDGL
jgi:hypothetical protein